MMPSKKKAVRPEIKVEYPEIKSLFIGGVYDGEVISVIATPNMELKKGATSSTYIQYTIQIAQNQQATIYVEKQLSFADAIQNLFNTYQVAKCGNTDK